MPSSLSDWNPNHKKVDVGGLREGLFASGAYTMIAAGPPRLDKLGAAAQGTPNANWALPIGIVQNFSLSQNRQFNRFFELGSERSYFISGRTVAQAGFSRILYHGPSILRMMYAFYNDTTPPTVASIPGIVPAGTNNPHDVKWVPGYENLYLNLASDLFSQPCGLLVYMKDSNENTLGAIYLEETYIPSHSIAMDAQGVVVQEQVSLQPERIRPIAMNVVPLNNSYGSFGDTFAESTGGIVGA